MLKMIEMDTENTVGIQVDGKIETSEFETFVELLERKLEAHAEMRLYIEIVSFKGFSLEAFLKDLKFSLSNYNRFSKEALVTDVKWLKLVSSVGDKLTPKIAVRAFSFAQKEAAREWVQA